MIDYIYYLRTKDEINSKKLENKYKVFKENKINYKRYYTFYGHDFENKLPNGEDYYIKNRLLINFLYF